MALSWEGFEDLLRASMVDSARVADLAPVVDEGADDDVLALAAASHIGRAMARLAWETCRGDVDKLAPAVTNVTRRAEAAVQNFGAGSYKEFVLAVSALDNLATDLYRSVWRMSNAIDAVTVDDFDACEHARVALHAADVASIYGDDYDPDHDPARVPDDDPARDPDDDGAEG